MVPGLASGSSSGSVRQLPTPSTRLAQSITLTLTLRRSDQPGFARFVSAVENRHSPLFRHFLTQRALTARFGPTPDAYAGVLRYLRHHGFRLVQGSANRLTLTVRGTRARAERAFGVRVAEFANRGRRVYANLGDPVVPRYLGSSILAVSGLSDLAAPTPADGGATYGSALVTAYELANFELAGANAALETASSPGGNAAELAIAINRINLALKTIAAIRVAAAFERVVLDPPATGAGQKVGVLAFSGFRTSDVADWLASAGLPVSRLAQLSRVDVNGGAPIGPDENDVLLGIQAIMSLAPGAQVSVYDAPEGDPNTSFQTLFNAMINDKVTVISNSFGYCEDQTTPADVQSIDAILASAAASGISVFNATGDNGSGCSDGSAGTVAVPADSPNATAVGGSALTSGPGFTYGHETWWDGSTAVPQQGQGGFGVSRFFSRPGYQSGMTSGSMRSVPDVVAPASPGEAICEADAGGCSDDVLYGGTSLSTPVWAAAAALLNEAQGHQLGLLNPLLYPLAGTSAFHSAASIGSDPPHVGLGSPNGAFLNRALGAPGPGPVDPASSTVTATSPNPLTPFLGTVPADGSSAASVVVELVDTHGNLIAGKTVTLAASPGSHAVISPSSGTSTLDNGAIVFTVKDATAENVTFTATGDGVELNAQPTIDFTTPPTPPATSGVIGANLTSVPADGTTTSTVTVTLQNGQGQGAQGKTVRLTPSGGHSTILAPSPATTDATGQVKFTVSDATAETVSYNATDLTDNNLAVPGSATVSFTSATNNQPCESSQAPSAAAGFAFTNVAVGFPSGGCAGPIGLAFDPSGNLFVDDSLDNSAMFKFGPQGGTADASTEVGAPTSPKARVAGLVFGQDGELYAGEYCGNVVQLDPATAQVIRTLATTDGAKMPCPTGTTVDPLTGDLLVTNAGFGTQITRISSPASATPAVSVYATVPSGADGIAIAPDGTIYVAGQNGTVYSVTGTGGPATPVVNAVAGVPGFPDGVAVEASPSSTHAQALFVNTNGGTIVEISDLTAATPTQTTVFSAGSRGDFVTVGPDGCMYATQTDRVIRLTAADGSCPFAPTSVAPALRLTPTAVTPDPAQGTPESFTATFQNLTVPAGTPVQLVVAGPNLQTLFARTDGVGQARFTYAGTYTGNDALLATATAGGQTLTSNPAEVNWTGGKHTTFLGINIAPIAGTLGQSVTLKVSLTDISVNPPTAIAGQTINFTLGDLSCSGVTDSAGIASCSVTPDGVGLSALTATFAGTSQYLGSSDSTGFVTVAAIPPAGKSGGSTPPGGSPPLAGVVGAAPVNTALPTINGTAKSGRTLTCVTGSWTNGPTGFTYQWSRYGTPLVGATSSTYTVQTLDEGASLTCTVVASNAFGSSAQATSKAATVLLPIVAGCPKATGGVGGQNLGLASLGESRTQAHKAYRHSSTRGKSYEDFFCLTPIGVRVGYASPKLLHGVSRHLKNTLGSRVVWVSTSNPFYAVGGIRPGALLTIADTTLPHGNLFRVGLNTWYLAPDGPVTAIFKARGGVVEEVGIADKAITRTHGAERSFLTSFS